jgi:predicted ATPase/DNA-binding CsgD family transcriptional regulator
VNPPNNLPLQLTSFIGREPQIAEVKRLLGTSRLLTLTGAGGSGKTRLALQVASQVVDEYPDGVHFVGLAPVTDLALVVPTVARILGVQELAGQPLIETLKAYLQGKELLLLLDNFEQVVGAAPAVVDLLLAAPDLKVMVTSREPLHLQGEQQYYVPALELPEPNQQVPIEVLSEKEAVILFVERARSVRPDFELTDENAFSVAQICVRVDGLPLAIELAAARIRILSPQEILSRLDSRLKLLTGGATNLPHRHQTLRNAIDWSYDLLGGSEQQLLRCMSVFQGGRSLEALEAVCRFDGHDGRDGRDGHDDTLQMDLLDGVQSLIDKSMLRPRAGSDGEMRYWLSVTIHEYAREKLEESGEPPALQKEHALYFMRLAEEAEPHLTGKKQQEWLDRLEDEYNNLRAALAWAWEQAHAGSRRGSEESSQEAAEIGLRIGGAIWRFWAVRGLPTEGREQLERALSVPEEVLQACSAGSRANALNRAGYLAERQGDYSSARSLIQAALVLGREAGDKQSMSVSLNTLGIVAKEQGDYTGARALYEESLALRRELGDKWGITASLNNLGSVAYEQGDYTGARVLIEESLALRRELGDKSGIVLVLGSLANVAYGQGDYTGAHVLIEESLALHREIGNKSGIEPCLDLLGVMAYEKGDYAGARTLYEECLALGRELGDKNNIAVSLAGLGGVAVGVGQVERGARLLGVVEGLLGSMGAVLGREHLLPYERAVAAARSLLGEEAFERAWQQGRGMSMEQAIVYAIQDVPEAKPQTSIRVQAAREAAAKLKQSYPNELSRREAEVLRLLAESLTNKQMAERLFLSRNTVRAHLYSIYSKIDVPNRGAAIRFANEHGLT